MSDAFVTVPRVLMQQIGLYLSYRPYREVAVLIGELSEAVTPSPSTDRKPEPTTETPGV